LTGPGPSIASICGVRVPLWIEKNCHESNPHLTIGREEYFLSADNKLMPVRKDQPPPDLRHFRQPQ